MQVQRTEVMFQQFLSRAQEEVSAGSRGGPRRRPIDEWKNKENTQLQAPVKKTEEHPQLQGPVQDTKQQAQPQEESEKREEHLQLQRVRETNGALSSSAERKKTNSNIRVKVRHMATKVCRSKRAHGRMYRVAQWSGVLCFILFWKWQEVEQNEQLTQESGKVYRLHNGSEGDRGNVMYSVMDTEGSVHRNEKEPSFSPSWIACCCDCQMRNDATWMCVTTWRGDG